MNNYKKILDKVSQIKHNNKQIMIFITRAMSEIICTTRHHLAVKSRPDCSQSSPYGTQLEYRLSETG